MRHTFQAFIDSLAECVDEVDLQHAMTEIATAFDLPCFAYLRMPDRAEEVVKIISTYPNSWTSHYVQRHYERIDPVVRRAQKESEPFEWGPGVGSKAIEGTQEELLERAARFGIRYGFTVPICDARTRTAALTFAVDERSIPFRRCVERKGQVFQLLAMLFHAKASRVAGGGCVVAGVTLSPRQLQCLQWAARGKSASDIAGILGISPRTVTFHIENAKARLGVRTIAQAVAILATSKPVMN